MKIDIETLRESKYMLEESLGSINDFPEDVKNTIANIYYKYACVLNMSDYQQIFSSSRTEVIVNYENAPGMVPVLRKIRNESGEKEFIFAIELFLDIFKYNISDASDKTEIRRKIERRFYKATEIPNLYRKSREIRE